MYVYVHYNDQKILRTLNTLSDSLMTNPTPTTKSSTTLTTTSPATTTTRNMITNANKEIYVNHLNRDTNC